MFVHILLNMVKIRGIKIKSSVVFVLFLIYYRVFVFVKDVSSLFYLLSFPSPLLTIGQVKWLVK